MIRKPIQTLIKQASILIVDDQMTNIVLLEKILRSDGYQNITSTTQPIDVLELYMANQFDIVLLDLEMPRLNGFEVLEQLQNFERDNYVPVLVVTAQSEEDIRLQALQQGAKDFITKPYNSLEVLNRTRNMIEVRILNKQLLNQNRILEERVLARTQELENTRFEVIQRLARAAEYRDQETGNHILRMSHVSRLLAEKLGWQQYDLEVI